MFPVKQLPAHMLGVRLPVINREKLVMMRQLASSGTSAVKYYMAFDAELKSSIITGLRIYYGNGGQLPANWVDGTFIADYGTLAYVSFTMVTDDDQKILDNHPLTDLVNTFTHNRKVKPKFAAVQFAPEKSYTTIPNGLGWGADTYIAFVFTYRPA